MPLAQTPKLQEPNNTDVRNHVTPDSSLSSPFTLIVLEEEKASGEGGKLIGDRMKKRMEKKKVSNRIRVPNIEEEKRACVRVL